MFNKKPNKAMYFPESLFFAKENLYGSDKKLFALDNAQLKFEKSNQYTLEEIEKVIGRKYDNFSESDLEVLNSKFKYCSIGILSKNKEVIKLLLKLITESNWNRTKWYSDYRRAIDGDFNYTNFSYNGFHIEKIDSIEKVYWLETNRLKGGYLEVSDTLRDLDLSFDGQQIMDLLSESRGISIKFQITESIINNLITIRYCYEKVEGLSDIKSVSLNAGKFKSFVRHLYKEQADYRMAIYEYDGKCATKEEYVKYNANQVGIGFTWYICNKALLELTLEHYEDTLLKKIFKVKAMNIEEEIKIVFPMIIDCYDKVRLKQRELFPAVTIKQPREIWIEQVTIDFGIEVVGNSDIHRNIYRLLTYIMLYLINKYNVKGIYSYRSNVNGNKSRIGIEKNY